MKIVLDAGALIGLERREHKLWTMLKVAASRRDHVLVPSTVVAQVWRGTRRQAALARALDQCIIAAFDVMALDVGVLCGLTRTSDICDAHVALVATRGGDILYTGDPEDLEPLIAACPGRAPVIMPC